MDLLGASTSGAGSFLAEWQSAGGASRPPRETPGAPPKSSARDVRYKAIQLCWDLSRGGVNFVEQRCYARCSEWCRSTEHARPSGPTARHADSLPGTIGVRQDHRSEERRVGKECRS